MKTYCVHFNVEYKYENIEAQNKAQALKIGKEKHEAGLSPEDYVEAFVMLQCNECGCDNDTNNKVCGECGKKL